MKLRNIALYAAALAAFFVSPAWADSKISALSSCGTLNSSTDEFLVSENATSNCKTTGADIASVVFLQNATNLTLATGGGLRTATSSGNTALLRAYDVDNTQYVTFGTLTAGNTPTFNLASDVTISGAYIYRAGGNDIATTDGGLGISWADPNEDQILFWDDSAGSFAGLEIGSGLSISGTEITATGGGGVSDGDLGDIVVSSSGTVWSIDSGVIVNADINASAAIDATKIADGSVSNAEFQRLDATSSIQTQLDGKQASGNYITALTGDVTASGPGSVAATIGNDKILESMLKAVDSATDEECLTYESTTGDFEWEECGTGGGGGGDAASITFDASGLSNTDATDVQELGEDLDAAIDALAAAGIADGDKGDVVVSSSGSIWNIDTGVIVNADINASAAIDATKLIDGSITNTELGYINTLSSNAQTQLDAKAALNSPVFTDDFDLASAGVRFAAADGVLTLLGLGNGNDENLAIDFDNGTANTVGISSSTGVTSIVFSGINLTATTFSGNASTATALAVNGGNCSSGHAPLGVDASGVTESCFDVWTEAENTAAAYLAAGAIDTSAELRAILSDEVGSGAAYFVGGDLGTPSAGVGTNLTALDGENIQNDTIDDDSIDFADVTGADLTLTDAGAVTAGGLLTANANAYIANGSTSSGVLRIYEDTDAGSNYASFQVPSLAANTTYTFPADDGDDGQVLKTNGSGILDWVNDGYTNSARGITDDYTVTDTPGLYVSLLNTDEKTLTFPLAPLSGDRFVFSNIYTSTYDLLLSSAQNIIDLSGTGLIGLTSGTVPPGVGYDCTYVDDGTSDAWFCYLASAYFNGGIVDEQAVEDAIFDSDTENIIGVWEVADDTNFDFGTDADWHIEYDEGVDNQLLFTTTNTSATATTDPMFEILVGTTPTANQEVFGVAKGSQASNTSLFTVDEDGDGIFAGTLNLTGALTFGGTGALNDVDQINSTTETTLESALDIAGEVTSTGMGSTVIADSVGVSNWTLTTPVISGKTNADGGAVSDDDCTSEQGRFWYDDTDAAFEFCNADSGAPIAIASVPTAAVQSDQETGTSTTTFVNPGVQQHHKSAAKAWIKFNGTGTVAIASSYNVTSVTDNGTGDYTINWDTDFSSADYVVTCTANFSSGAAWVGLDTQAAGSLRIRTANNNVFADLSNIHCIAFGDQ